MGIMIAIQAEMTLKAALLSVFLICLKDAISCLQNFLAEIEQKEKSITDAPNTLSIGAKEYLDLRNKEREKMRKQQEKNS